MVCRASRLLFVLMVVGSWAAPGKAEPEPESWIEAVAEASTAAGEPAADETQAPPAERKRDKAVEEPLPRAFTEMIDNIVITTRKRQEAIQETPLSITALGENSIKQLGVRRIQDITAAVPNLQYERAVGFTSARVSARGVGQSDPIGTLDPGVGLYVDGVFLPRAQVGLTAISDVERIEVVRGPQGTIFGKNTIGGAVNVITRAPQMNFGAEAEVRVGNFNLIETRAMLNVPLVDERVAARVSFATGTRDGFEKERLGGTDPNDDKLLGGRLQLLMLPSENLEILLSGDWSRENQILSPGKCLPVNSGGTLSIQILNAAVGYTAACADVARSNNPRRVETDISFLKDEIDSFGGSLRVSWEIGADTSLRSISSVRGLDSENFNDFDNTRVELIRPAIDDVSFKQSQISQELQLTSKALDGKLDYVLGLYGFKEKSNDQLFEGVLSQLDVSDFALDGSGQFQGAAAILNGPVTPAAAVDLFKGSVIQFTNKVDNVSYAAFGQATYAVTDRLSFTAGLRITQDRRRVFRRGIAQTRGVGITARPGQLAPDTLDPGDVATFFDRSRRDNDVTPSASISYKFSDDILGYVGYSTGFKSGGFNGRAFPLAGDDSLPIEIKPEDLTSYEVGVKAAFADDRIALNAAAFYSIYEDIQLVVVGRDAAVQNVNIALLNAGESRIQGGEFEMVLQPLANLQLRSSVGVLNDRFTKFDDPSDPRAKDRRLQFVSSYQTSTSIEYSFSLLDMGMITARTDWSTRSRQFLDVTNTEALESGKRGLLDARLSLQLSDGATELALFGKNLLDREYLASGVDFSATFGQVARILGPPRTYGLEVRRRF